MTDRSAGDSSSRSLDSAAWSEDTAAGSEDTAAWSEDTAAGSEDTAAGSGDTAAGSAGASSRDAGISSTADLGEPSPAAAHWLLLQELFAEATGWPAELTHEERDRRAGELCGHDPVLVADLLSLLDADAQSQTVLDGGILHLADTLIASPALTELVEQQIGPYRLLRVLGEGGMGVVYLAERTDIGGLVAIKLLRDAWLSPLRLERFQLEQRTLARLNHPGIARVYDSGTTADGTPWFVMEYAEGEDLGAFWAKQTGHAVREALALMRRICDAVQYAHSHAVIHRDLKPGNIVVTPTGDVKLLDFGISKELDADALAGADATRTLLRLLTPGYAAPEQHTGAPTGMFTDVYSLGVVLYELLTGQLPRPRTTTLTANSSDFSRPVVRPSEAIAHTAPAARSELSRSEWADLDLLCLTALQPEPARRYSSVDALSRDIENLLSGRPLAARPDTFCYVAGKFVRRQRRTLIATAAVLLLLATTAVVYSVRLRRARNDAVAEAQRAQRIQHFMQEMLGDGDAEAGPSQDLKVVTLLDRAAKQSGSLDSDPETEMQLDRTLGSMYSRLGQYGKSEQILSQGLARARSAEGPHGRNVAPLLIELAKVHGDAGNVKEASAELDSAMAAAAPTGGKPDPAVLTQAHIATARIALQGGDYNKVVALLTPIAQQQPGKGGITPYDLHDSVALLAMADIYLHQYEQAERDGQRAVALDLQLLGAAHPETADDLMNIAAVKASQGDFPASEQLYRRGIGIMQAWYGAEHPDVVAAKSILARVLLSERKVPEAEALLRSVLLTEQKIYPPVHERIAFTLDALGELSLQQGHFPEAEDAFGRAASINCALLGENNARAASSQSNLGVAYLKDGKLALAEATLRGAVTTLQSLPSGSNYIGLTRGRWGRSLLQMKRYPEAEAQLVEADDLMKAMPHPPALDLRNAREDLVAIYNVTHRPQLAQRYQAELASTSAHPASIH